MKPKYEYSQNFSEKKKLQLIIHELMEKEISYDTKSWNKPCCLFASEFAYGNDNHILNNESSQWLNWKKSLEFLIREWLCIFYEATFAGSPRIKVFKKRLLGEKLQKYAKFPQQTLNEDIEKQSNQIN